MRSSCEAVLTNVRRDCSWPPSRCCMVANARARSPISSRPPSSTAAASGPASATSQRGGAQRGEPAHEPRRERDAGHERDAERDERGRDQRAPDDVLGAVEVSSERRRNEHAACPVGRERERDLGLGLARRRGRTATRARSSRKRLRDLREVVAPVDVGRGQQRARRVEDEHVAAGLARAGLRDARASCGDPGGRLAARGPRTPGRAARAVSLERRERVLPQLAVQREQHQQRGDHQRQRAHGDERRGEAPAQAAQLAHGACSR